MRVLPAVVATILLVGPTAAQQSRIRVGPNVPVSTDGEGTLFEVVVAANPVDPKNLLGGGMLSPRTVDPDGTMPPARDRAYYSMDGGYSWRSVVLPELEVDAGGGDPQVAFGRTGTAYYVGLGHQPDLQTLYVYRSKDGGQTWDHPAVLGGGMDHPQMAVDHTTGRFSGRVYVSYNGGGIYVFRSEDDGRSWIGPIQVARPNPNPGSLARITRNPLVLSDGGLFVPWVDFPILPPGDSAPREDRMTFLFATSNDGGSTFTPPQPFRLNGGGEISGTLVADNFQRLVGHIGSPIFAVDNSDGPYRDRVYMVWADEIYRPRPVERGEGRPKGTRILFSYSSDRGKSWSKPKVVASERSGVGNQFGESIAVNREGIVGIAWYDTRDTPRGARAPHVHRYFTASTDGGETFLTARPVSSVATDLERISSNSVSGAMGSGASFELRHEGFDDHSGGHYILGLAADTEGTFHAFWPDGRTGSYQIWATRIRVERTESVATAVPHRPTSAPVLADVTKRLEVVLEPLRRPSPAGTIELPVRLKNVSDQPIYGPITVEVTRLEPDGMLLNAANRRSGVGATFDYSRALGDLEALAPGAISEGIVWRFKAPVFLSGLDARAFAPPGYQPELPHVSLKVTARVAQPKAR
jgi:hypothetical protein